MKDKFALPPRCVNTTTDQMMTAHYAQRLV